MIPVLVHFGIVKIYTMGLFLTAAFFAASFLLWKNIKLTSYKEEEVFDLLFLSMLGSLFFSRFLYVAMHFDTFGFSLMRFILINGYPGLSLFGALAGGLLTLLLLTLSKKIDFLNLTEYIVSPMFLALTIAKIGGFLSGSDIGTQTKFLLSVHYAGVDGARHIVALYEALLFFIGFLITYKILFIVRRDKAKSGTSLMLFFTYFGLVEMILDNLKQNHLYLAGLSFDSVVGAAFFIVGTIFLLTTYRHNVVLIVKNLKKTQKKHDTTPNLKSNNGTEDSTS